MRRRVAICKFNLADYSRWEGQEGVGLQGETPPALSRRTAAAFIRCRPFYHRTDLVAASALTSYSRDSSRADYRACLLHCPTRRTHLHLLACAALSMVRRPARHRIRQARLLVDRLA